MSLNTGTTLQALRRDGSRAEASGIRVKKVWIDLENSPHVPFFLPIIEELKKCGYSVLVTARDCFQVCALADLHHLPYKRVGHHYGKTKILKLAGLGTRTLQLLPTVLREKPDVAVSHGSRSQILLSALLGIPSITILDYEFAKGLEILHPRWVMYPDVIGSVSNVTRGKSKTMKYPGIKEDVYVPRFTPDPAIRDSLGLRPNDLVVTVRPPADEAHYHNPESEILLDAVFELLSDVTDARIVLLPRNHRQEIAIRKSWSHLFDNGKIMVPDCAVDGLNLIWYSDLVISGGGTMNREAAALGVPVYSIFRGTIGAVDHYLADSGRLMLLESVNDVRTKIDLRRRNRSVEPGRGNSEALRTIVANVVKVVESTC